MRTTEKTITVENTFGKDEQINREDFISIWLGSAKNILHMSIDCGMEPDYTAAIRRLRTIIGKKFDSHYANEQRG